MNPWVILSPWIAQVSKLLMINISSSNPLLVNIYTCVYQIGTGAGAGAVARAELESSIGSGAGAGAKV